VVVGSVGWVGALVVGSWPAAVASSVIAWFMRASSSMSWLGAGQGDVAAPVGGVDGDGEAVAELGVLPRDQALVLGHGHPVAGGLPAQLGCQPAVELALVPERGAESVATGGWDDCHLVAPPAAPLPGSP
jgi:hypothetical protein